MNRMNTDIYLFTPDEDRTYFVDKTDENEPRGLCERFDITLAERPQIPTAQMRYDETIVPGRDSSWKRQEGYDDIAISFPFNFISPKPRETYYAVANHLRALEPGTRLRLSDDTDGTFRVLARTPRIEPLNNDLVEWGDFIIHFDLEPFRYIEQPEVTIEADDTQTIVAPTPNILSTPQVITHLSEDGEALLRINDKQIYSISESPEATIKVDGTRRYAYADVIEGGSGYAFDFNPVSNSIRFTLRDEPFEGFNHADDIITPSGISSNRFSGSYLHFDVGSDVLVADGGPDSFLIFAEEDGTEITKPLHVETVKLNYQATARGDAEDVVDFTASVGFIASENQRFIMIYFSNTGHGLFRDSRILIETPSVSRAPYESGSGRPFLYFENDNEVTLTIQDVYGDTPDVSHTFRTEQGAGEVTDTLNLNRYMKGAFPNLSSLSNVIESTTLARFRPLWKFL